MILWTYTIILRLVITYAARVWWLKTTQNTVQQQLQQIQRHTFLNTTGVIRICPTAALEVQLEITPLHIYIQTQDISSPLSRSRLKKLKLQYMRGHLRIIENPNINQLIRIEKDRIPKQYNFDQPYKMVIKSLSKWGMLEIRSSWNSRCGQ